MEAIASISEMIREAEKHADDMSKDRIRAVEYNQGIMRDTPHDKGRSSVVSRDVRTTIKKVLPSIARTILGNEKVVEFQPVNEGDEPGAEQATDYVNYIVMPECDGFRAIEDAIHDALLLRNGILHVYFEEKLVSRVSSHTGLPDDAFAQLVSDADVEVLEHSEREEMVEGPQMGPDGAPSPGPSMVPVTVHDLTIRRMVQTRNIKANAIPRERFLIHPDAISLDDSALTGSKTQVRRSDLVAMGYDKETVFALSLGDEDDDYERDTRRDFVGDADETHRANELIDYYDLYIRFDKDGDGIAELRHMCFGGGTGEQNLLMDEEADEVQFVDVKVMTQPHQWEGISLFDDIEEIQRVKTVLLRQTLDNLYWQNNPQPVMQKGAVLNEDAVFNPEFGLPIRIREGVDARAAYGFTTVPFVAQQSFGMLEYLDREAEDRTGVSDASSGLSPDALQNMTAKASAMIEQAGIGQTELMVRTLAEGLRKFFKLVLKLVVKHQDVPRTVRLRGEWVQMDPRQWNAEMDCSVNTGLGAGTRERDMQVMQFVMGMQEKLLAGFGPDNPFVKPDNVYAALEELVRSAGLKSPALYFTEPDPAEVQAKMEAMANAPDPEQMKAEAQMQLKQMDVQADMQKTQAKMQAEANKELSQMQADLQVKQAELAAKKELAALEAQSDMALKEREIAWEREKLFLQQRAELALQGLGQREDGSPVNDTAEGIKAAMTQMQQILMALGQSMASANRPKRVVRDQMGEIVGLEAYDPMVN